MPAPPRLLLIDDDQAFCELLRDYFKLDDFAVEFAHDGISGLQLARSGTFDLAILDVMLPAMSGFEVLRHLREDSPLPVLMLTARGDDIDCIVGLETGADDYIAKPCNPRQIAARVRAILRRTKGRLSSAHDSGAITVDDVALHSGDRSVTVDGQPVALTGAEFNLLEVLLRHAGQVVSRDTLAENALSAASSHYGRSLDTHVAHLRKKLGPNAQGKMRILSVRGVGYQYILPWG